jgi:reverse transcriptase-like protein
MDPKKIQGVADWSPPTMVTKVRQFLGFTGYYRYFVPNYSKIARPLLDLIKKATIWHWGPEQMKAFETLKTLMCHKPVLVQPNFNKCFYLQMDASAYGVGAILSQEAGANPSSDPDHNHNLPPKNSKPKLHPIAYYSATFTPMERNYNIYERELLAIMKSLTHWQHYLGWTKLPFIILTNHANLQYWKALKNLNRQMAWWHADLQEYNFVIHHIPGKTNTGPDILSRPSATDQGKEDNRDVIVLPPEKFA